MNRRLITAIIALAFTIESAGVESLSSAARTKRYTLRPMATATSDIFINWKEYKILQKPEEEVKEDIVDYYHTGEGLEEGDCLFTTITPGKQKVIYSKRRGSYFPFYWLKDEMKGKKDIDAVFFAERDLNQGIILNCYYLEDFKSGNMSNPIATFKYIPARKKVQRVNLAALDILDYYNGRGNIKPVKGRVLELGVTSVTRTTIAAIETEKFKAFITTNVKILGDRQIDFTLLPIAKEIYKDSKVPRIAYATIKNDENYGPYIEIFYKDTVLQRYYNFGKVWGREKDLCSDVDFARLTLVDYIIGKKNKDGKEIVPPEYYHFPGKVYENGVLRLDYKDRKLELYRLNSLKGKEAVFIRKKDKRYGYVFHIHDAAAYEKDKKRKPEYTLVRNSYFGTLVPIGRVEIYRAREFIDRDLCLSALSILRAHVENNPQDSPAIKYFRQANRLYDDVLKALNSPDLIEKGEQFNFYLRILADSIITAEVENKERAAEYFRKAISDAPDSAKETTSRLIESLDFSSDFASQALINVAIMNLLSVLPDEEKMLQLAKRVAEFMDYKGPYQKQVKSAGINLFRSIPDEIIAGLADNERLLQLLEGKGVTETTPATASYVSGPKDRRKASQKSEEEVRKAIVDYYHKGEGLEEGDRLFTRIKPGKVKRIQYGGRIAHFSFMWLESDEEDIDVVFLAEKDLNQGVILSCYYLKDYESANFSKPIATFKYISAKEKVKKVNLAALDMLDYYRGRTDMLPVEGRVLRVGVHYNRDKDVFIATTCKELGKNKKIDFSLLPESKDILSKDEVPIDAYASIKNNPIYGPYIQIVCRGRVVSRYYNFGKLWGKEKTVCTTVDFSRLELVDYIFGNRNMRGELIEPPECYYYPHEVEKGRGKIWLDYRGREPIIVHGLTSLKGKRPVFVRKRDDKYGLVFHVHDAEEYRENKSRRPEHILVRNSYFKTLVRIDKAGVYQARELIEKGLYISARCILEKYFEKKPKEPEASRYYNQAGRLHNDILKALEQADLVEEGELVSFYLNIFADSVIAGEDTNSKKALEYFREKFSGSTADAKKVCSGLTQNLDFGNDFMSQALKNIAIMKLLAELPFEYKVLSLAKRITGFVDYAGPYEEQVKSAGISFFKSVPKKALADLKDGDKLLFLRLRRGWTYERLVRALEEEGADFGIETVDSKIDMVVEWERGIIPPLKIHAIIRRVLGDYSLFMEVGKLIEAKAEKARRAAFAKAEQRLKVVKEELELTAEELFAIMKDIDKLFTIKELSNVMGEPAGVEELYSVRKFKRDEDIEAYYPISSAYDVYKRLRSSEERLYVDADDIEDAIALLQDSLISNYDGIEAVLPKKHRSEDEKDAIRLWRAARCLQQILKSLVSTELCDWGNLENPEISQKATEITQEEVIDSKRAEKIKDWVNDNIKLVPEYEECWKTKATETLASLQGAYFNRANLIVAMLRSIGIPARYRIMTVKKEAVKNMVDSKTYAGLGEKVEYILPQALIRIEEFQEGMKDETLYRYKWITPEPIEAEKIVESCQLDNIDEFAIKKAEESRRKARTKTKGQRGGRGRANPSGQLRALKAISSSA